MRATTWITRRERNRAESLGLERGASSGAPLPMPTTTTETMEDEQAPTVPAGAKVWVLHITHKHGEGSTVHSTEDKARRFLHRHWVLAWWHQDGPGRDGEEIPPDREEAIEAYFHEHEYEFFDLEEIEVDEHAA